MRKFRKFIIILSIVFFISTIPFLYNGGKYYKSEVEEAVKAGQAIEVEFNREYQLDKNAYYKVKRIIILPDITYIRYSVKMPRKKWGFGGIAYFKTYDDKGKRYSERTGAGRSTLWANEGIIGIKNFNTHSKYIKLVFDVYDRHKEIVLDIEKGRGK